MADDKIALIEPGTANKYLDAASLIGVSGITVFRERQQIAGSTLAQIAAVINSAIAGTEYGLVTRPIGSQADNAAHSALKFPTLPARASTNPLAMSDGQDNPLSLDLSGNLRTVASLDADRASGSTNLTANTNVAISTTGCGSVSVHITSYTSGTLFFEGSNDNFANPIALTGIQQPGGGLASQVTSTGLWIVPVAGLQQFRVRLTGVGSAVMVWLEAGAGSTLPPLAILPPLSELRAATLHVTATAAVNTALTLTLPLATGLFHYITSIQVAKLYSVIGVAAGAGNIITSTNLPGNPAWTTEQLASAAGTVVVVLDYKPTTPLKSSVVGTATTIVCPQQLQTIWRINVSYFTAV